LLPCERSFPSRPISGTRHLNPVRTLLPLTNRIEGDYYREVKENDHAGFGWSKKVENGEITAS